MILNFLAGTYKSSIFPICFTFKTSFESHSDYNKDIYSEIVKS